MVAPTRDSEESDDPEVVASNLFSHLCEAIKAAAKKTLPVKRESKLTQRKVSLRTKSLFAKKRSVLQKENADKEALRQVKLDIQQFCLDDFKTWVDETVAEMEKSNELGDVRSIYNLVNLLCNKPRPPPCNLTVNSDGNILQSPDEAAACWRKFLQEKFQAT